MPAATAASGVAPNERGDYSAPYCPLPAQGRRRDLVGRQLTRAASCRAALVALQRIDVLVESQPTFCRMR